MQTSSEVYKEPFIFTSKGTIFYLNSPVFDIEVMAHSLSLLSRYNGHCKYLYTVAQHSCMVSEIAQLLALADGKSYLESDAIAREALLHDGTEAYLSDIPAPFKPMLPDWRGVDAVMETALRDQFDLPMEKSKYVKLADWYALFIEAEVLLPPGAAEGFVDPDNYRQRALQFQKDHDMLCKVRPASPEHDAAFFLNRYNWLTEALESFEAEQLCPF